MQTYSAKVICVAHEYANRCGGWTVIKKLKLDHSKINQFRLFVGEFDV